MIIMSSFVLMQESLVFKEKSRFDGLSLKAIHLIIILSRNSIINKMLRINEA